jgi:hypothetical protein
MKVLSKGTQQSRQGHDIAARFEVEKLFKTFSAVFLVMLGVRVGLARKRLRGSSQEGGVIADSALDTFNSSMLE